MASRSYEVQPWRRHGRWAWRLAFVVPLGLGGLLSGDVEGGSAVAGSALVAWGLGTTMYEIFYRPSLVTLTDTGVLLEASARHRFIAWDELASVHRQVRKYGDYLIWKPREGGRVVTLYGIRNRDDMKATIATRAPRAEIKGW